MASSLTFSRKAGFAESDMRGRRLPLAVLVLALMTLGACRQTPVHYRRALSDIEQADVAKLLEGGMVQRYYQGSAAEQMTIRYAISLDPANADLHRERGIAWAKRGLKSDWQGYDDAARLDPLQWQGYRGYMHLYFNRDYRRAIADFTALDSLTPGQTPYPQATSVHYMRGVAHMQLGEYATALDYFDRWLAEETVRVEEVYLGPQVWQYRAVCLDGLGRPEEAERSLAHGLEVADGESGELWYYLGRRHEARGSFAEAEQHYANALAQATRGYTFGRPYVEEFYEVSVREIEERMGLLSTSSPQR